MNTLIPDVRIVLDGNCVVREASSANELSEEAVNSWVGRPWAETLAGIDTAALTDLVRNSSIDGVTPIFHLSQRFPSGLVAPLEYLMIRSPDRDEFVAVGRDVRVVANLQSRLAAARQSMERDYWKMRELESRYRSLYEASSDPLLLVDARRFVVIEANPAAILVLNLSSDDAEGSLESNLLEAITPSEREMVDATLTRAREYGTAPRMLVRVGDRGEAYMLSARVLEQEQSDLLLVHLMPTGDSSVRNDNVARVSYSIGEVFDLAPDGIALLDERGVVLDANQSFLGLIEQPTLADVTGSSVERWLGSPGGDWKMLLDSLRLCGSVRQYPATVHGRLGGTARAEISAVMKSRADGGFIVLYLRDIGRRLESADEASMLQQFLCEMSTQLGQSSLKEIVSAAVGLVERYYIEVALEAVGGNRTAAARMLGVSRQGLYDKLARYGVDANSNTD